MPAARACPLPAAAAASPPLVHPSPPHASSPTHPTHPPSCAADNFLRVTKVKRESAREAAASYCDGGSDSDDYSAASDSGGSDPEQLPGSSNIVPAGCLSVWKYLTRKASAFCAGLAAAAARGCPWGV